MKTNLTRADARHRAGLISNVHYDINLDVTGAEQFRSRTTITFDSTAGETFFDLVADSFSATLDGAPIEGAKLDLSEGSHTVVVDATITYNRTGEGLHKFTDPVDNKDYLYTQFEPAMAMKVFAALTSRISRPPTTSTSPPRSTTP